MTPDELADKIRKKIIKEFFDKENIFQSIEHCMQEYHRKMNEIEYTCTVCDKPLKTDEPVNCQKCLHDIVRENKEGLFTREDLFDAYIQALKDNFSKEFNQWLDSGKENKEGLFTEKDMQDAHKEGTYQEAGISKFLNFEKWLESRKNK